MCKYCALLLVVCNFLSINAQKTQQTVTAALYVQNGTTLFGVAHINTTSSKTQSSVTKKGHLYIAQNTKVTGFKYLNSKQAASSNPKTASKKVSFQGFSATILTQHTQKKVSARVSETLIGLPFNQHPLNRVFGQQTAFAITAPSTNNTELSKKQTKANNYCLIPNTNYLTPNTHLHNISYLHKKLKPPFGGLGAIRPPPLQA